MPLTGLPPYEFIPKRGCPSCEGISEKMSECDFCLGWGWVYFAHTCPTLDQCLAVLKARCEIILAEPNQDALTQISAIYKIAHTAQQRVAMDRAMTSPQLKPHPGASAADKATAQTTEALQDELAGYEERALDTLDVHKATIHPTPADCPKGVERTFITLNIGQVEFDARVNQVKREMGLEGQKENIIAIRLQP